MENIYSGVFQVGLSEIGVHRSTGKTSAFSGHLMEVIIKWNGGYTYTQIFFSKLRHPKPIKPREVSHRCHGEVRIHLLRSVRLRFL